MRRRALCLLLIVLALCAAAQARSWRIAKFHSNIVVEPDGSMMVSERITAVFSGQFQGIYRTIPIDYPGPRGTNYALRLKVISVTDESGGRLEYKERTRGQYREIRIYVPGASDATRTVILSYTVANGIRYFPSHDELYWNVTGNDWPVPIEAASATVVLPESAAGQLRAQAFTGAYGSTSREATAEVNKSSAFFETTNPLPMRGGLTVNVYVPKGILREPSWFTKTIWFLRSNPILLLPLFAFAVMYTLWHYKGRDPDAGMSVAPMYEPPAEMPPAEVGALVDDRVDGRDIAATLIGLAVRGYVRIEEIEDRGWIFTNKDYLLRLLKPEPWQDVTPYESTMLRQIFLGGTETKVSSLANRFYTALPGIKSGVLRALKDKGMYRVDPDDANAWRVLGVILIALPFVALELLGWVNFFESPWVAGVAVALAAGVVFFIGRHMTAKTFQGVRTVTHVLGFQEFMQRVESDRLRRMPADTFEKFLPYAIALGVEERWAKAFEGIVQTPPQWYHGTSGDMFTPRLLTSSVRGFSNSAMAAFVAAPRSSSSGSGFGGGGGGFSGGGFGGGGGGAF